MITLTVFVPFSIFYLTEDLKWDHLWVYLCILARSFIFREKPPAPEAVPQAIHHPQPFERRGPLMELLGDMLQIWPNRTVPISIFHRRPPCASSATAPCAPSPGALGPGEVAHIALPSWISSRNSSSRKRR